MIITNTSHFGIAIFGMILFGIQYSLVGTCVQSIIQAVSDDKMRGRVLALYGLIWIGGAAIGSVVMGALSEVFGLTRPLAVSGAICLGVFLYSYFMKNKIESQIIKHQTQG